MMIFLTVFKSQTLEYKVDQMPMDLKVFEKIDESPLKRKMILPLPVTFNPERSFDRLEAISHWLLDELYATEDDLSCPTDNGYTRGCTAFG